MIDVTRRYKFVVQDRDRHGNLRTYLRRTGKPKVRLHETPGTDAFDAEYRRALATEPKRKNAVGVVTPGTLTALVVAYYRSADFKRLDVRTQRTRRGILEKLIAAHGHRLVNQMTAAHVLKLRDDKADKPEAANSLMRALRAIFKHGLAADLVRVNPVLKVPYLASTGTGAEVWTPEDVAQFEAHHPVGTKARLAMALLLFTGQRRSDVVQFGRQHVRDGVLTFTQHKNRHRKPVTLALPIIPELARIIAATPARGLSFLETRNGTPYTADSFGNRFRKWCREADLPHCSPHGLRKAAASRLAELGCSANEIAAVTGHRTLKEVAHYTAGAAQKVMAASALARMTADRAFNEKVPPGGATPEWDESLPQDADLKGEVNEWCPGKDSNLHDLAVTGT